MDQDQETSWDSVGSEGNNRNTEGETWNITSFNYAKLKCSNVDVNQNFNIQDSEIPKLTGINWELIQPIDKVEPWWTTITENHYIFILVQDE